jgi:hypothetical protein
MCRPTTWRIENMFKCASAHHGIDTLADYLTDIGRPWPRPDEIRPSAARTRAGPRPRADQVAALGTRSATGQPRAAATIAKYRAALDAALEHDPGRVRLPLARSPLIGLAMLALGGHPPPAGRTALATALLIC